MPPPIRGTWRHSMILGRAKSGNVNCALRSSECAYSGSVFDWFHSNTFHTLAVLLFFSLVYALSCDCCGLCNRHWWHDSFRKRRIVCHELLLGGWQDRLPLQKSLHTHCKGSPSRPNVQWWLIRFSQIMMLCLSPFTERVSVLNGKNTKYKKIKSALIKVGGWTIIRSLWWHIFFAFLTSFWLFCSLYIHNLIPQPSCHMYIKTMMTITSKIS